MDTATDPEAAVKPAPTKRGGRRKKLLFTASMTLGDFALWLATYFTLDWATGFYTHSTPFAVLVPFVCGMVGVTLVGGFRYTTDFASLRYASEHLIAFVVIYPLAAFILYVVLSFGTNPTPSRGIFTAAYGCQMVFTLLLRRVYWFARARFRKPRPFLVIADEKIGPGFYRDYVASSQIQELVIVAANHGLLDKELAGPGSPLVVRSAPSLIDSLIRGEAECYEGVIVASDFSSLRAYDLAKLGRIHFGEMPVLSLETFYEKYWERVPLPLVGPAWPLEAEFMLVNHSFFPVLKRISDIMIALLALIIASPVMALAALMVRCFDGSPVLFRQMRVGARGEIFTLYKFRTMKVGSDTGDLYTREGDNRVTRIGNFLRKTRLDELPQLWNVMRGDMSMIGPRAEWNKLVKEYEQKIAHYQFRHLIRPGITGWAQVNYPYGASLEDTLQKLSYDLYYIKNFSLRLDAEVVLKTIHVMIFGKGR